jgi:hypothetical protein
MPSWIGQHLYAAGHANQKPCAEPQQIALAELGRGKLLQGWLTEKGNELLFEILEKPAG